MEQPFQHEVRLTLLKISRNKGSSVHSFSTQMRNHDFLLE
jgi:hypothetical protein